MLRLFRGLGLFQQTQFTEGDMETYEKEERHRDGNRGGYYTRQSVRDSDPFGRIRHRTPPAVAQPVTRPSRPGDVYRSTGPDTATLVKEGPKPKGM